MSVRGDIFSDSRFQDFKERVFKDRFFAPIMETNLSQLERIEGLRVLEMGCGKGDLSVLMALHGATVLAFDIDGKCLEGARILAEQMGVSERCHFLEASSEAIPAQDQSIDLIISKSTWQYVDRDRVLAECLRVLAPGGQMLLHENLPHNPCINFYRTARRLLARQPDQKAYVDTITGYLSDRELAAMKRAFARVDICHFHLTRVLLYRAFRVKKPHGFLALIERGLAAFDQSLLRTFPSLGRYAWLIGVVASRPTQATA